MVLGPGGWIELERSHSPSQQTRTAGRCRAAPTHLAQRRYRRTEPDDRRTNGPVIVAGHAYAGAVIAAANDERVKALVYVAALAPEEGRLSPKSFTAMKRIRKPPSSLLTKTDRLDARGRVLQRVRASRHGRSNCSIQSGTAADRTQVHPRAGSEAGVEIKPVLVSDRGRRPYDQSQNATFMANRMRARTHTFAVDHTPLLTAPEKVLQVIIAAAQETLS